MPDLLNELRLPLTLCFGMRTLRLQEMLELSLGDVFGLDRGLNETVTILAGGNVIASGEVIAVEGNYAVRVTSVAGADVSLPLQS